MVPASGTCGFAIAALLTVGLGSMVSCGNPRLDINRIEAGIQQDIEARGGVPVKEILCPSDVLIAPGETFECAGELSQGGDFTVTVRQEDRLGNVSWDIPNSRSLLNLEELERYFQQELAVETEAFPLVDCDGVFRVSQPGETFECQVANAIALDQSRIEAIAVTIDSRGDLSWQQIRQQQLAATSVSVTPGTTPATRVSPTPTAAPGAPAQIPAAAPTAPEEETTSEAGTGANAGPPAATAEDFLNRPGAMDGF